MKSILALLALFGTAAVASMQTTTPAGNIGLQTLSTDASRVTGGDVLVQLTLPPGTSPQSLKVTLGGKDITSTFRPGQTPTTLTGVVTGMALGRNTLAATADKGARGSLEVTNYPITGPVLSGPWQQPFVCQTEAFTLPDGSKLGAALDANCSSRTVVQHVYRPVGTPAAGTPAAAAQVFKALPNTTSLPADVAKTTTTAGKTVNFIVRVETGTMNRGIYQNAVLHDPTVDPDPTPFTPPSAWNRRLLAVHGSGCTGGWYIQGPALGTTVLDEARLGQGYAVFNNTLNHPNNSCNAFLAGETTMMGKEHFIEEFGVPAYTISAGRSGGAYTSLQVADAFPGLIDGVDIGATFPDALSLALSGLDGRLLMRYTSSAARGSLSEAQIVAVSGYHSMKAFLDAAVQSQRTDPVPGRVDMEGYQSARFTPAVPADLKYDPMKNPKGARPTVFDAAKNVYGVNPATGAALRPFDNAGVQYGLAAVNSGVITVQQFLDLNEKIGGYDQDANFVASRSVGDTGAIKRAYQAGLNLGANGGLRSIPIMDNATSNEASGYHYGWFHFALRERVRKANGGSSDNMVMWRSISGNAGQEMFDAWVTAYKADTSSDPQRVKMLRAKPKGITDGCYDKSTPPKFIADPLPFSSKPESPCSELYPVYSNPRKEAGGPLAADVIKCQLKPIDAKDYSVTLSAADLTRLRAAFPGGVCDWSKPGVEQTPVVGWASFGPSPVNQVFGAVQPRSSSR